MALDHPDASDAPLPTALGPTSRLRPLLGNFLTGLAEDVAAMEESLAATDLPALRSRAHQVKGAAGMYGYPAITSAALELENSIKAEAALDEVAARVHAVASLCRRALAGHRPAAR